MHNMHHFILCILSCSGGSSLFQINLSDLYQNSNKCVISILKAKLDAVVALSCWNLEGFNSLQMVNDTMYTRQSGL